MTTTPRIAAAFAALAASLVLAPAALAEPVADIENPLIPIAPPQPHTVINTDALPLNAEAQWLPVPGWGWSSPFLTGVEICSPFGTPVHALPGPLNPAPAPVAPAPGEDAPDAPAPLATDIVLAPSSDVQHSVLVPGEGGNPQGWTATVSFAPYVSQQDSIGALHQYKRYIEACPEVNPEARVLNDGGIARNDPTAAHGAVVTHNYFLSLFAVATDKGVVELALTRPTDIPQADLSYSPADIVAALRGAVVQFPDAPQR